MRFDAKFFVLLCVVLSSGADASEEEVGRVIEHAPDGWEFPAEDDPFTEDAALDLGALLNEKLAGETGFVRLSEDGESFVRGDGRPIRFWGVVSGGWEMSPEEMERHAKWLAKRGVNIARVHADLSVNKEGAAITDVNQKALDGILRWVAVCKRHGIYTMISPYWAHSKAPASWGIEGYAGEQPWGVLFFNEKMQEGYKAWVRALYTTPNPYAGGVPLKDEPAVAIAQVKNEDSLLFWTFDKIKPEQKRVLGRKFFAWAAEKYGGAEKIAEAWRGAEIEGDDPAAGVAAFRILWYLTAEAPRPEGAMAVRLADQLEFLTLTQKKFYEDMRHFYREELGVKSLLNAMNWKSADPVLLEDAERYTQTAMDVIAVNFYTGGEHFGENNGYRIDPGHTFTSRSVLRGGAPLPAALKQVAGYPMMITETAWVHPNLYQSEGPFLMTALQSLNGVDITCWFAVPGRTGPEWEKDPRAPFWPVGDSFATFKWYGNYPMQAGQFPAWAFIFRRALIAPAPEPVVEEVRALEDLWRRRVPVISESGRFDPNRDPGEFAAESPVRQELPREVLLAGPVKVRYGGDPAETRVNIPQEMLDELQSVVKTTNGQFMIDKRRGVALLDAPAAQGVCGFLRDAGGEFELGATRWTSSNDYASLVAVALDELPLAESRHVLVQAGTTSRLGGFRSKAVNIERKNFSGPGEEIVHNGEPPWRVERTRATLEIRNPHLARARALCPNLYAQKSVDVERGAEWIKVTLPEDALYVLIEALE